MDRLRAAIGMKARTGRAILVSLAGSAEEPRFVEKSQIPLLPEGAFAPYHAAENLEEEAARVSVKLAITAAHGLAERGIAGTVQRLGKAGHKVGGCGILVGTGMPDWSVEEILAVHVRMHKAEGELFRDVLVAGAKSCKLKTVTLHDKSALEEAAGRLGWTRTRLAAALRDLGKAAGPPWGKDQKEAAAAALVALKRAPPRKP